VRAARRNIGQGSANGKGEDVKATDFDFNKDLKFNLDTGYTTFKDSRLLIFDANSIGLLRQNLIEQLGMEAARKVFLRFGFQSGYADFMQMKMNYTFDSEIELLAAGPVIHTWEGIVHAQPREIKIDKEKDEFFFTGVWSNSYEAEQHLSYYHPAKEPVCWSLMGYASGWCTAFWKRPIIAIEPVCVGKGDDHCEWKIMRLPAWGVEADPYVAAFGDLLGGIKHG
jgi:hypothetical protein